MKKIRWAAEVTHVQEVSLRGRADLGFWKERLAREGLVPAERDGHAQILVTAGNLRFMGIRFSEVSISVGVKREEPGDAAFLVDAFNSVRFFAWCERAFFSTPYHAAECRVSANVPASLQVMQHGNVLFRATMGAGAAGCRAVRTGEGGWCGPVYLPDERDRDRTGTRMFFARIRGQAQNLGFAEDDTISVGQRKGVEALWALKESDFAAEEWVIRRDAEHAKSKTYRRGLALRI